VVLTIALEVEAKMKTSKTVRYFDCGLDAYNKGQFAMAVDYFRMVLHATPSDWNAQFYLGMALAQNMQAKAAQVQFRSISELCPDSTMRRRATLAASSLRSFTA